MEFISEEHKHVLQTCNGIIEQNTFTTYISKQGWLQKAANIKIVNEASLNQLLQVIEDAQLTKIYKNIQKCAIGQKQEVTVLTALSNPKKIACQACFFGYNEKIRAALRPLTSINSINKDINKYINRFEAADKVIAEWKAIKKAIEDTPPQSYKDKAIKELIKLSGLYKIAIDSKTDNLPKLKSLLLTKKIEEFVTCYFHSYKDQEITLEMIKSQKDLLSAYKRTMKKYFEMDPQTAIEEAKAIVSIPKKNSQKIEVDIKEQMVTLIDLKESIKQLEIEQNKKLSKLIEIEGKLKAQSKTVTFSKNKIETLEKKYKSFKYILLVIVSFFIFYCFMKHKLYKAREEMHIQQNNLKQLQKDKVKIHEEYQKIQKNLETKKQELKEQELKNKKAAADITISQSRRYLQKRKTKVSEEQIKPDKPSRQLTIMAKVWDLLPNRNTVLKIGCAAVDYLRSFVS